MNLKVKKLHPDAKVPKYAHSGDAGLDLYAIDDGTSTKYGYREYSTALAFEIPQGYVGLIYPRSSISERGMMLYNCVGVIDSGYRGEVTLRFKLLDGEHTRHYRRGDRIGQLVVQKIPEITIEEVDELSTSSRGSGGYGSTGA